MIINVSETAVLGRIDYTEKFVKTKSRMEIVTETTREISLRIERRAGRLQQIESCDRCLGMLLSINEAVQFSGLAWIKIVRLIISGEVHSTETTGGEIYVCSGSLSELI